MTSLAPLLEAAPVIQMHAASALAALVLGPVAIHRRRRDRLPKTVGYVWIVAMAAAAISSFWIHSMPVIGPFGPIHVLSALALVSLVRGLAAAIRRDIATHRTVLRGLYYYGVGVPMIFTLLPGRVMSRVLFGPDSAAGLWAVAVLGLMAVAWHLLGRRRAPRRNA